MNICNSSVSKSVGSKAAAHLTRGAKWPVAVGAGELLGIAEKLTLAELGSPEELSGANAN